MEMEAGLAGTDPQRNKKWDRVVPTCSTADLTLKNCIVSCCKEEFCVPDVLRGIVAQFAPNHFTFDNQHGCVEMEIRIKQMQDTGDDCRIVRRFGVHIDADMGTDIQLPHYGYHVWQKGYAYDKENFQVTSHIYFKDNRNPLFYRSPQDNIKCRVVCDREFQDPDRSDTTYQTFVTMSYKRASSGGRLAGEGQPESAVPHQDSPVQPATPHC